MYKDYVIDWSVQEETYIDFHLENRCILMKLKTYLHTSISVDEKFDYLKVNNAPVCIKYPPPLSHSSFECRDLKNIPGNRHSEVLKSWFSNFFHGLIYKKIVDINEYITISLHMQTYKSFFLEEKEM